MIPLYEVFRETLRLAGDLERGGPERALLRPCRAPVAERRSPRRRPLRRPARPPLDGARARVPNLGDAGLGPTVNLQACLAAASTSLPAPCDQRRADLCGGWRLPPPPPPPALAPGEGHPPPSAGPSPSSSC